MKLHKVKVLCLGGAGPTRGGEKTRGCSVCGVSGERGVRWTLLREEDLLVLLASSRRDEREKVTS